MKVAIDTQSPFFHRLALTRGPVLTALLRKLGEARALLRSSSHCRAALTPRAMSSAWAAILYAMHPAFTSSAFGRPTCSFGVT
jgi:hypothetical protein